MKIAILTDSNAGIDINEAKELGVHLAYTNSYRRGNFLSGRWFD